MYFVVDALGSESEPGPFQETTITHLTTTHLAMPYAARWNDALSAAGRRCSPFQFHASGHRACGYADWRCWRSRPQGAQRCSPFDSALATKTGASGFALIGLHAANPPPMFSADGCDIDLRIVSAANSYVWPDKSSV